MSASVLVMVQTLIASTPMGAMSAAVPMAIEIMVPSVKVSVVNGSNFGGSTHLPLEHYHYKQFEGKG